MCGIVAVYGKPGTFDGKTLERATQALYHRGPDGQRHWLSQDRRVGLGHARLSIIDLEGGHQPLSNEDGAIHAVVNGEIYDFERIRQELMAKGHRLATGSDSEVLIHLYEDLGLDALQQLRGEFAFVLWDNRSQRLIAGRDRFGIKPLFFAKHEGNFYFASEVKALFAAGVPARWDTESLFHAHHMGGPLQGRSLFRGVQSIPPGHVLVLRDETVRSYRYWDFQYPTAAATQSKPGQERELIEEFRELFDEAVRLRLRADVPVGVYLSGGLDSCSVLGTAAKLRGAGLKAFNISFEEAAYDEEQLAREMAKHSGADYHSVRVTPQTLADNFVASVRHGETLVYNSHGVAKFMLSKVVRDAGYKVVLTGEGSDEILAGYPHFRRDLLLYSQDHGQADIKEALGTLAAKNEVSKGLLFADSVKGLEQNAVVRRLGFVPSWLEAHISNAERGSHLIAPEIRRELQGYDPYAWFLNEFDVPQQLSGRHPLNQSLYLWSKNALPNYLLTILGDRMEMGHSVEGRVPFLDHKLVEFATRLPIDLKIRNMTEKYILREAAKPVLTQAIYERQKHPFIAPPSGRNQKDPFLSLVRDILAEQPQELGILDVGQVRSLFHRFEDLTAEQRQALDPLVMMTASLVVLQKEYGLSL